jgi:hypothetical protein
MLKKISLAALAAATLITGSIGLAHAESGSSGEFNTSLGMQNDMREKMAGAEIAPEFPTTGEYAYGNAPDRRPARSHYARSSAKNKHNS